MRKRTKNEIALYTTIYPGSEPFLRDWYRSVMEQTDRNYKLWIGLDSIGIEVAKNAMGADPEATWVTGEFGDTPAQIRQRAFARIVEFCNGVVLVDSDDVLHLSRVASARVALETSDLAGCALRLVDKEGRDLGMNFGLPHNVRPEGVLPRNNVFGLSNSAFRSDLLRRCLPIPAATELVDWFLATQAWLYGARLAFDPVVRMDYRQHSANMARVKPPFGVQQVIEDTERVRRHFQILLASPINGAAPDRLAVVDRVATEIEMFYRQIILRPDKLDRYLDALNELRLAPLWWSSVAHPSLRKMWLT
jgi:hypothetical protein